MSGIEGGEVGLAARELGPLETTEEREIAGDRLAESWVMAIEGAGEGIAQVAKELNSAIEGIRGLIQELGAGAEAFLAELQGGLENAVKVLGQGLEWLRDHPEVVEAAARLAVVVLAIAANPENAMAIATESEEIVTKNLQIIARYL
jgi:hypothetical protein